MKTLKDISLVHRILLVLAIPCLSYLIATSITLYREFKWIEKEDILIKSEAIEEKLTEFTHSIQKERKNLWLYQATKDNAYLNEARKLQAEKQQVEIFKNLSWTSFFKEKEIADFLANGEKLSEATSNLNTNLDISTLNKLYSETIKSIFKMERTLSTYSTPKIGSELRGLLSLETAIESSYQFLYQIEKALIEKQPINTADLLKLIEMKSLIKSNIDAESLDLSEDSKARIKSLLSSTDWKAMEATFVEIVSNAKTGNFQSDFLVFEKSIEGIIASITSVTKIEFDRIKKDIHDEKAVHMLAIYQTLGGILLNTILIVVMLIFSIKGIRKKVASIYEHMAEVTKKVSSVSTNLNSTSHHLGSGSEMIGSAVEETIRSMENIGKMVENSLEKCQQNKGSSTKIQALLRDADRIVKQLESSMSGIQDSNHELQDIVKIMNDISDQAAAVNDIVFQTKLLSFNASIEAERAGEHGRGFSVVAGEVGILAKKSGQSSDAIEELLASSHIKIKDILSKVSKNIEAGVQVSDGVSKLVSEINEQLDEIVEGSAQIMTANQEQSIGVKQITAAIHDIEKATKINSDQSIRLNDQASTLKGDSEGLESVSEELAHFVLGNKAA